MIPGKYHGKITTQGILENGMTTGAGCHPGMFKLSIMQENKWEVGRTLEATLLTPSNIPPLGYGQIYHLLSRLPRNHKQYEVTQLMLTRLAVVWIFLP
jgi:hypothetical protein